MNIISLGAGVQSTTLYWMACRGEILPRPELAIFADTGDEPAAVMAHLETLKAGVIPIEIVAAGNIYQDTMTWHLPRPHSANARFATMPLYVRNRDGKPGMLRRQCTSEYKIRPIRARIRELLKQSGLKQCVLWFGISLDEVRRLRASDVKYICHRYPLVEMSMRRHNCVDWLQAHGYPVPPKSSCRVCPYHEDRYWQKMKEENPADWEAVCKLDETIRQIHRIDGECYLHRSLKPLRELEFKEDEQGELFEECEGYCNT